MKKRLSLLFLSFACLVAALLIMPAVTGIQAAAAQEVTMKRVTFPNKDITLVGNIFLPKDFDSARKYPAIICVHPAGSVKEQTAGLYARKLAEKGFISLAFDASYVGESGGEPRYTEAPFARMEDIHCAVDYLTTLSYVDERRIGALGLCAGGGYVMGVTPTERPSGRLWESALPTSAPPIGTDGAAERPLKIR